MSARETVGSEEKRRSVSIFLLGLIPQCIGHTAYNWSLRWLPPALVGLLILVEPVGAILLAYIILDESLTYLKAAGGAVVLLGIYLAARATDGETQKKASPGTPRS